MELWYSDILYDSLLQGTQLTNGLQLKQLWLFQHSHHGHVFHRVLHTKDWAGCRCYSPATSAWFLTLPKDNLCLVTHFQFSWYFLRAYCLLKLSYLIFPSFLYRFYTCIWVWRPSLLASVSSLIFFIFHKHVSQ